MGIEGHSGSKYVRIIRDCVDTRSEAKVDVYSVLLAFDVTCPARQHCIKKLLVAGMRGKGTEAQDLREASDALERSVELMEKKNEE